MKNILINLLSNAIKYSPENKTVFLTSSFEKGKISFIVIDQGIGIPVEDQAHLFQTFFRAKNVEAIQGTGLGLYIVKKYLDIMGGTIEIKSKMNEGTTIVITIPQ